MKEIFITLLAIIGGLITVYEFSEKHPWLLYAYPLVILVGLILLVWRRVFGYWIIRRDLDRAEELLRSHGIVPNLVIAFDRSSGIFAGMLAQRLGIGELLVFPRSVPPSETDAGPRRIIVGTGVRVPKLDLSKALVFVFHLRTGATLEAGMTFMKQQHLDFKGHVIALYATKGGSARWPKALCVHTIAQNFIPNENFPWIKGKYKHL